MRWSSDQKDRLTDLVSQKLPTDVIASRLGLEVKQVVDKIYRMGLDHRQRPRGGNKQKTNCGPNIVTIRAKYVTPNEVKVEPRVLEAKLYLQRRGWMVLGPNKDSMFQVEAMSNMSTKGLTDMAERHGFK